MKCQIGDELDRRLEQACKALRLMLIASIRTASAKK